VSRYVPRKGDIIAVTLDPQAGHEQRGRRPALVVSNDLFNRHTGLCMVCPVTTTRRDHPFHVSLPDGQPIDGVIVTVPDDQPADGAIVTAPDDQPVDGVIMVEQLRSLDYRARRARRIGIAPDPVLQEVLAILDACLY
jgi:mRNA interferase MazF